MLKHLACTHSDSNKPLKMPCLNKKFNLNKREFRYFNFINLRSVCIVMSVLSVVFLLAVWVFIFQGSIDTFHYVTFFPYTFP